MAEEEDTSVATEVRQGAFSLVWRALRVSRISGPVVEFPEFLETLADIISPPPGRS